MLDFIVNPIYQLLIFLYRFLGQDLGLAIIALTLLIRAVMTPLTLPSLRSAQKMQQLKPQIDRLKKKYPDKTKFQQAQLDLYRQHGINPLSGCLPQLIQVVILIALYQVFIRFLGLDQIDGMALDLKFFWLDLSQPDPLYILPALAGVTQLVFSLMMQAGLEAHVHSPKAIKAKKTEENSLEMAQSMSQQMIFLMPIMTVIIALRFPSGLALYWVVTTLFSLVQQYFVSGWGGLIHYKNRLLVLVKV